MCAGDDQTSTANIRGQLIDLVILAIEDRSNKILVLQVANGEIIGCGRAETGKFEIDATNPCTLINQTIDEMVADKPARSADQNLFSRTGHCFPFLKIRHRAIDS